MPYAATVRSKTTHGCDFSPATPGSSKVKIDGFPAWRAFADFHYCPLFDGSKPHAGGKVMKRGRKKVFIEGLPAVRVGDEITEASVSPNFIKNRNSNVVML